VAEGFTRDEAYAEHNKRLLPVSTKNSNVTMARQRYIYSRGEARRLSAVVPEKVALDLQREAKKRGVTVGRVVLERLIS
jgi:hypothetical protein